jgi:hypothetical protein
LAAAFASFSANAVDYYNTRITGVGIGGPSEDYIRFTIDQDANAIFTTQGYSGEQLKRVAALIYAAYTSQSPIYMVRSSESSSSGVRHYTQLTFISLESRTWD